MPVPRLATIGKFRPELLFRPRSVAVIGSATADGAEVLENIRAGGFAGPVMAAERIEDVAGFDEVPDLAFVCGPAVGEALAAAGRIGTRAAVVISMTNDLAGQAKAAGLRAFGPGSFGIAVPSVNLYAIRSHLRPRAGRAALVSQSAALCRAVLDWAEPNGVGFSHIVGIGGNQDLGFAPVLDWLSRDAGTGAILLDIRRIRDARRFLSAARAAARLRPIVAIRAGGRLLDPDGGADAILTAALDRAGVLSVETFDDFLGAAETLIRARAPRHETLAIVTNAIGPARMAADAVLREGLRLAPLAPETRAVLRLALPREAAGGDIAYVGADNPVRLAEVAALLAGAPEVGGVLIVHAPAGATDPVGIEAIIAASRAIRVPLLVCAMGETTGGPNRRALAAAGVAVFAAPEQAVRGFRHLVQNRRNRAAARELPPSTVLKIAPDRAEVARRFGAARAAGRAMLMQEHALAVLSAYGIPVVASRAVATAAEAVQAARTLGFPVVLKRRRLDRPASHGPGALVLDLRSPAQVSEAAARLDERRAEGSPGGFLVQRQVGRARELLVRTHLDPLFGPAIAFGLGGTAAAFFRDVAVELPPLNLPLARALIGRTRVALALGPLNDAPAADVEAVADTLVRVSQLLVDFPDIAELNINPLFADANGVRAADAWVRLRNDEDPAARLALPPYPAELIADYEAKGQKLVIRPIRPEDADAHAAFFARLTPEDIRYRFFSSMRELTSEQIARMTQIDYDREMALIAVREQSGETIGVGRLVREGETGEGEFAVIVEPDAKGMGLASHLMRRLFDWAPGHGVTVVVGQVLAENAPMIAFVRHLGFSVHPFPGDASVVEARLELAATDQASASSASPTNSTSR
jgi:acetyltransferase